MTSYVKRFDHHFHRARVERELERINTVVNDWLAQSPDDSLIRKVLAELAANPTTPPDVAFINKFVSQKLGLAPAVHSLFGVGLLHSVRQQEKKHEHAVNPITLEEASDLEGLAARLVKGDLDPDDVERAASFVSFLLTAFGPEALIKFGRSVPPDGSFDQACRAATGKSLAMLELQWQESIVTQAGKSRGFAVIGWTLRAARPHKRLLALLIAGNSVQIAFAVVFPILMQQLFDNGIMAGSATGVIVPLTLLLVGLLLTSSGGLLTDYCISSLAPKIMNTLRVEMFEKAQAMSERSLHAYDAGEITSNFSNDLTVLEKAVALAVPNTLPKIVVILGSVIVAFALEWIMALAMLISLALTIFVPRLISRWAVSTAYARGIEDAKIVRSVKEDVHMQAVSRDFALRDFRLKRFKDQLVDLYKASFRQYFSAGLTGRATNFGISVAQILVVGLGGFLAVDGDLSGGTVVAFFGLLISIGGAATFIGSQLPFLIQAAGGLDRINTLLAQPIDVKDVEKPVPLKRPIKSIQFDNVCFSYTGEKSDLDNVSVKFSLPMRVALVGPSGSGKSTFLRLLTKQFYATEGRILLDDVDIRDVSEEDLRSQMAVVPQDTSLYQGSVRENIRVGRLDATDEEVEAAAKEADIHDVIMGLASGYDTDVGEMGKNLSGGQRQRIAIARAELRNADILVLDEATSALDSVTEKEVSETLDRVTRGKTVFAITHKLNECEHMDLICVFKGGKLLEFGTHDELLSLDTVYAELWNHNTSIEVGSSGQVTKFDPQKLHHILILSHASYEVLQKFASVLHVTNVEKGTILSREGKPADRFWMIGHGMATAKVRLRDGSWRQVEQLGTGETIGQAALIKDAIYPTTVETASPCTMLSLSRKELVDFYESNGLMTEQLIEDIRYAYERYLHIVALEKVQSGKAA